MTAWMIAGPAAVGKSTLGAAIAHRVGAVLLDLDTLTNPLLDALGPAWSAAVHSDRGRSDDRRHWNDGGVRDVVRPARYATLRAVAREQTLLGLDVVLVAPFTAELTGQDEWHELVRAVGPEVPTVLWLMAPAAVRADRMAARGEARDDGHRAADPAPPQVPHTPIDATLPLDEQLTQALPPPTR